VRTQSSAVRCAPAPPHTPSSAVLFIALQYTAEILLDANRDAVVAKRAKDNFSLLSHLIPMHCAQHTSQVQGAQVMDTQKHPVTRR